MFENDSLHTKISLDIDNIRDMLMDSLAFNADCWVRRLASAPWGGAACRAAAAPRPLRWPLLIRKSRGLLSLPLSHSAYFWYFLCPLHLAGSRKLQKKISGLWRKFWIIFFFLWNVVKFRHISTYKCKQRRKKGCFFIKFSYILLKANKRRFLFQNQCGAV